MFSACAIAWAGYESWILPPHEQMLAEVLVPILTKSGRPGYGLQLGVQPDRGPIWQHGPIVQSCPIALNCRTQKARDPRGMNEAACPEAQSQLSPGLSPNTSACVARRDPKAAIEVWSMLAHLLLLCACAHTPTHRATKTERERARTKIVACH